MKRRARVLLVLLAVLSAAPFSVPTLLARLLEGARHAGEPLLDARRRVHGAAYADGIERIRAALPENAEYLLVEAADSPSFIWVQYDLAPRRPLLVGEAFLTPARLRQIPRPKGLEWIVVARGAREAPQLLRAAEVR